MRFIYTKHIFAYVSHHLVNVLPSISYRPTSDQQRTVWRGEVQVAGNGSFSTLVDIPTLDQQPHLAT